jgi:hypothetical protein
MGEITAGRIIFGSDEAEPILGVTRWNPLELQSIPRLVP